MKNTTKLSGLLFLCGLLPLASAWSATPVDLRQNPTSLLQNTNMSPRSLNSTAYKTVSSYTDFKQTQHVRLQQTFNGFPVWGGDAVVHTQNKATNAKFEMRSLSAKSTQMNGTIYQGLAADLEPLPAESVLAKQQDAALSVAKRDYNEKNRNAGHIIQSKANRMVYVDKHNKAHWAYYVELLAQQKNSLAEPVYILDATSHEVYKTWNNLHTLDKANTEFVSAGGYGGNEKIGYKAYDGLTRNTTSFSILRDTQAGACYLEGSAGKIGMEQAFFIVKTLNITDGDFAFKPVQFACAKQDSTHADLYWNESIDFAADNDAFYNANIINNMYLSWYKTPVVFNIGKKTEDDYNEYNPIQIITHRDMSNAAWIGVFKSIFLGDGDNNQFAPFTSLDIIAHELSHGYTEQHSNLVYQGQSGGLNEAFSDMAGVASGYFLTGESSWKVGADIMLYDEALRFMDNPRHDCVGREPYMDIGGNKIRACSIDHMKDYKEGEVEVLGDRIPYVDVHLSSGIFNRAFYLMAQGWGGDKNNGTRKAFNVMVQANRGYWTPNSTFQEAACGVMEATHDYGYDDAVVSKAMAAVGLDTGKC